MKTVEQLVRNEKLEAKQRLHRELTLLRKPIAAEYVKAQKKLLKINKQIQDCGRAIYDLKHNGETPHVTDHALVRYLERVEHMDIMDLKLKVATHKNAQREGNAIVTVNPDEELE